MLDMLMPMLWSPLLVDSPQKSSEKHIYQTYRTHLYKVASIFG